MHQAGKIALVGMDNFPEVGRCIIMLNNRDNILRPNGRNKELQLFIVGVQAIGNNL